MQENETIPPQCLELLEHLAASDSENVPYRDLPPSLQNMDVLEECRDRGLVTYVASLENDPGGGQLGSGTWASIVGKVKREKNFNDHKAYLHVTLTGSGDRMLRERRLVVGKGRRPGRPKGTSDSTPERDKHIYDAYKSCKSKTYSEAARTLQERWPELKEPELRTLVDRERHRRRASE